MNGRVDYYYEESELLMLNDSQTYVVKGKLIIQAPSILYISAKKMDRRVWQTSRNGRKTTTSMTLNLLSNSEWIDITLLKDFDTK